MSPTWSSPRCCTSHQDPKEDIHLYINSPGGCVYCGHGHLRHHAVGRPTWPPTASAWRPAWAALLLAAGAKGKRNALPYSRIMIHQPWGGARGQASEVEIEAREILRLKRIGNEILAKHTGKPVEQVEKDTDRNYYLSAEEARGVRYYRRYLRSQSKGWGHQAG